MSTISVQVKLRAQGDRVEKTGEHSYLVHIRALPIDGKANEAVIAVLAKYFRIPRSSLSIIKGKQSRLKIIVIEVVYSHMSLRQRFYEHPL